MLGISNKIIGFVISNKKLSISNRLSLTILLPNHVTHTKCCCKGLNTLSILIVLGHCSLLVFVFPEHLVVNFRVSFEWSSNCTTQGWILSQTEFTGSVFLFSDSLLLGNRDQHCLCLLLWLWGEHWQEPEKLSKPELFWPGAPWVRVICLIRVKPFIKDVHVSALCTCTIRYLQINKRALVLNTILVYPVQ